MFGIGLTLISTLLLVYIVWRISSIQKLAEVTSKKTILYIGIGIWIILVSGRLFGHGSGSIWASTIEFVGITITAVLFLIFTCLFPIDLVTGFGRFFPRLAPSQLLRFEDSLCIQEIGSVRNLTTLEHSAT